MAFSCCGLDYLSFTQVMPGSSFSSKIPEKAPPPVEIWVILSPKPRVLTAAGIAAANDRNRIGFRPGFGNVMVPLPASGSQIHPSARSNNGLGRFYFIRKQLGSFGPDVQAHFICRDLVRVNNSHFDLPVNGIGKLCLPQSTGSKNLNASSLLLS